MPEAQRLSAQQKVNFRELMLGQIANYCPIMSRNTMMKNSTSIQSVWNTIRNTTKVLIKRQLTSPNTRKKPTADERSMSFTDVPLTGTGD